MNHRSHYALQVLVEGTPNEFTLWVHRFSTRQAREAFVVGGHSYLTHDARLPVATRDRIVRLALQRHPSLAWPRQSCVLATSVSFPSPANTVPIQQAGAPTPDELTLLGDAATLLGDMADKLDGMRVFVDERDWWSAEAHDDALELARALRQLRERLHG